MRLHNRTSSDGSVFNRAPVWPAGDQDHDEGGKYVGEAGVQGPHDLDPPRPLAQAIICRARLCYLGGQSGEGLLEAGGGGIILECGLAQLISRAKGGCRGRRGAYPPGPDRHHDAGVMSSASSARMRTGVCSSSFSGARVASLLAIYVNGRLQG